MAELERRMHQQNEVARAIGMGMDMRTGMSMDMIRHPQSMRGPVGVVGLECEAVDLGPEQPRAQRLSSLKASIETTAPTAAHAAILYAIFSSFLWKSTPIGCSVCHLTAGDTVV